MESKDKQVSESEDISDDDEDIQRQVIFGAIKTKILFNNLLAMVSYRQ